MKRWILCLAVLAIMIGLAPVVQADPPKDRNFTGWFDFAEPSVASWYGNKDLGSGGNEWLVIGTHFSGCRVGRLRTCGLGMAWGVYRPAGNEGWSNALLLTAPQSIRLTSSDRGDDGELDFVMTPFYDTRFRRWGFAAGFSIGG